MLKQLIFAGIGSRKTPDDILQLIFEIAQQLAISGWLLRSGHAQGADIAFEDSYLTIPSAAMEIYIPWHRFNHAPMGDARYIRPTATPALAKIAAKHHPAWNKCQDTAKLLHMRNVCQILGEDLNTPADMVICWTPNGSGSGGTGQAIRIAKAHDIPVFDLGSPDFDPQHLVDFVNLMEEVKRGLVVSSVF